MKTLASIVPIIAAISYAILSPLAQATTPNDPAASETTAVLTCHLKYAHRYANASPATPTEIAYGADAHCKPEMDFYGRQSLKLARSKGLVFPADEDYQAKLIENLAEYAHNYTIDAVIQTTANPVLTK